MVPGIHNLQTVGSSPMQRIQQAYAQGSPLYTSGKGKDLRTSQANSSPRELLEQSTQAYMKSNRLNVRGYEEHDVKESIYLKRVQQPSEEDKLRSSLNGQSMSTVGYYNTITNPVNGFASNPYLAKERAKAVQQHRYMGHSQSMNLLASAGNSQVFK